MSLSTDGLFVYISTQAGSSAAYQRYWGEWIRANYPQWAFIDLDNQSDSLFLSHVQRAMEEQRRTLILVDTKSSDKITSLGSIFTFLQRAAREKSEQIFLILQGEQLVVEKLGKAFHRFYQTSSQKETEKQIRQILEVN